MEFFFNISETQHIIEKIFIVASLLTFYAKCYDKANMRVCALSLWGNSICGLIYFDQFI